MVSVGNKEVMPMPLSKELAIARAVKAASNQSYDAAIEVKFLDVLDRHGYSIVSNRILNKLNEALRVVMDNIYQD